LLVGSDRLAAARQRSLAATAQWSYELLATREQRVFQRLSVFPEPFTLEAAEAVAGAEAGTAVLHLVDCSLLVPPSPGADGRDRYLMLETLRAYGAQQLTEAGGLPETVAALVSYAVSVAERARAGLDTSAGELASGRWLDAEDATLHRGLDWALEYDPQAAARLAVAMAPWWRLRGRYTEGYALLQAAAGYCPPDGQLWSAAQVWLGWLSSRADAAVGLDHFTAARDALEPLGPSPMLVQALAGRADRLRNTDRAAESATEAHRALAMARDLGDAPGEAIALNSLGAIANYAGDHQAELAWLRQAQRIDPARVSAQITMRYGISLATCLMDTGDLTAAKQACAPVVASAREAGATDLQAESLALMAELDLGTGQLTAAAAQLRQALGLAAHAGTVMSVYCLDVCGHLCARTQRFAEALSLWAARSAFLHLIRLPELPQDIARRQEPLGRARLALGPAGTQAAEERGAAMTFATAVEFATLLAADDLRRPRPAPSQPQLSARERQLITLVAQGHTDTQIAAQLYLSVRTVRTYLDRVRDKTGYRRRADLTRLALNIGLV
jgi:DNA-binding CsgD family transcriptional regulator